MTTMAAQSSGQRISRSEASVLKINPIDESQTIKSLTSLYDIFVSSFGPQGHAKVVHNNCGGDLVLTTSSCQLLQALSISNPVLKLITAVIKEHVKTYSDGGLFVGVLCLRLIINALRLDIHRRLITEVYDLLLKICINFMTSLEFSCKRDIRANDSDVCMKLIKSMFSSKPACLLFDRDLDHMCRLTFDGYRKCDVSGRAAGGATSLLYVTVHGKPSEDSRLLSGILYESPQIPAYCQNAIPLGTNMDAISVVLVQTSMAGDSTAFLDAHYELPAGRQTSDVILSQLLQFTDSIVAGFVKVLLCQRVVHPKVKKILKQHGVFVFDRLGSVLFEAVHHLTGGAVLDPFSTSDRWHYTSLLGHLQHVVINNKSYIHMDGVCREGNQLVPSPVYTVILCHRTEQAVQEVKAVYERCQHILSLTEKSEQVLCGGGCWQSSLCLHLINTVPGFLCQWINRLCCSKQQLLAITESFVSAIRQTLLTSNEEDSWLHLVDISTGHHFVSSSLTGDTSQYCKCGAISHTDESHFNYVLLRDIKVSFSQIAQDQEKSNVDHATTLKDVQVVDAYLPFVNAIKAAVTTSCMVLGIQNYIQDN